MSAVNATQDCQQLAGWLLDMAAASDGREARRRVEAEAGCDKGRVDVIIGERSYSGTPDGTRWVVGECLLWERPDWLLGTLGAFVLAADTGDQSEVRGKAARRYDGKLDPKLLGQVAPDLRKTCLVAGVRRWQSGHGSKTTLAVLSEFSFD